jgi:hypothetical protein
MGKKILYPVWVNGTYYNNIERAAEGVYRLSGKEIEAAWLANKVREYGSVKIYGILVSVTGPKEKADDFPPAQTLYRRIKGNRLLDYPPGEDMLERGIRHMWR